MVTWNTIRRRVVLFIFPVAIVFLVFVLLGLNLSARH